MTVLAPTPTMTAIVTRTADPFRAEAVITGAVTGFPGAPPVAAQFRIQGRLPEEHRVFRQVQKAASAAPPVQAAVPAEDQVAVEPQGLEYAARREALYGPIRKAGIFTWDSMYDQEYALATVHPISAGLRNELKLASERLGAVFARTAQVVMQSGDDLLTELGVPEAAWDAVRTSLPELLPTTIGRFDFANTSEGLKLLEFNAETPTDVVEAFYLNGKVCEWFGVQDPNAGMTHHLQQAFAEAVRVYQEKGASVGKIIFSSVDWHDEDAGTTRYLLSQACLQAEFAPLAQLRVFGDRLQVFDGTVHTPVDLMYRLHPLEKMAAEQDSDGYPTGRHLLDIMARGKLAVINSAAAILSQTKAMQALIWNLHEAGEFFSPDEHAAIQKYFLPTYFENRFAGRLSYVTKPLFGREGGAITVWGPDGEMLARDEEPNYWDQPCIYQQYAELPQITVETLDGLYCGRMIFGSFLVAGQGSGIVARVGCRITGNMAYFLPLYSVV